MAEKPWAAPMPDDQFERMRDILGAPSPVGLEGAMTYGVLKPFFDKVIPDSWTVHQFRGNAGIVVDSHPGRDDMFSVMVIGHADKIRMQVRSIGDDGKIYINSDSFIPGTLIGHEVLLFSEDPSTPGKYRVIRGGTVEAIGAIHFASVAVRKGDKGIQAKKLYLELQIHGEDKKKQVEDLGIRPGDPLILDRKIRRGFSPDTFYGAYLDNGLGCFVTAELCRLVAEKGGFDNVRVLGAMAAYEEIGRFGSRVLAGHFDPDVVIGADVNHDYVAAPSYKEEGFSPIAMGEGYTFSVGSITNAYLNSLLETVSAEFGIPFQRDVVGRDTGTDAMAAVFANIDAAATSIGFPIRNMHTISECGHTGDVLASIHALYRLLEHMDGMNGGQGVNAGDFKDGHPRLDSADALAHNGE